MLAKYTDLELVEFRKTAFNQARETVAEPTLRNAMQHMHSSLPELQSVNVEDFCQIAEDLDIAVEYGCQYPNIKLINKLLKYKAKGLHIICVSDYYHVSTTLSGFIHNCNINDDLFEGIYVSCEEKASKAEGTLYKCVMNSVGVDDPSDILMIGDNPRSDYERAKDEGITVKLERHLIHKGIIRIKEKIWSKYSDYQIAEVGKFCYRYGYPFSEYIVIFFEFIQRLHKELSLDDVSSASFMAREGYYLQILYKEYCELCIPEGEEIETKYFRCSRRSIFSGVSEEDRIDEAQEPISIRNWLKSIDMTTDQATVCVPMSDKEIDEILPLKENDAYRRLRENKKFDEIYKETIRNNKEAFLHYIDPFLDGGNMYIVDSGWKGTTQAALSVYYHIPSTGYYIGIQEYTKCPQEVKRKGLVFEEKDGKYYDYVGMNFPFYQELLSAPHGSAVKYIKDGSSIHVKEEWDPVERELYDKRIKYLQDHMMTQFMGLCAWQDNLSNRDDWHIAKIILHSNMFAYDERYKFARDCEKSFFINFQQEKKGGKNYDYKEASIGPDIIVRPEKYIRLITKIQRSKLYDKKIVRVLYPVFSICFYGYTLFVHAIKGE